MKIPEHPAVIDAYNWGGDRPSLQYPVCMNCGNEIDDYCIFINDPYIILCERCIQRHTIPIEEIEV